MHQSLTEHDWRSATTGLYVASAHEHASEISDGLTRLPGGRTQLRDEDQPRAESTAIILPVGGSQAGVYPSTLIGSAGSEIGRVGSSNGNGGKIACSWGRSAKRWTMFAT